MIVCNAEWLATICTVRTLDYTAMFLKDIAIASYKHDELANTQHNVKVLSEVLSVHNYNVLNIK